MPREIHIKTCLRCGKSFGTDNEKNKVCLICQRKRQKEYQNTYRQKNKEKIKEQAKEYNQQYKKPKIHRVKPDAIPLWKYISIIEKYNREHNTDYTYGQFTLLVDGGRIKI